MPIMRGTQAPLGTLVRAAPQKRPCSSYVSKSCGLEMKRQEHTVKETKYEKISDSDNPGQVLYIAHLDRDKNCGGEHHCGNCEATGCRVSIFHTQGTGAVHTRKH